MKKKFLLLMVLLLCIGCTRINNNNYDVIVNDVIENSNNIYNTNSLGYKYYLHLVLIKFMIKIIIKYLKLMILICIYMLMLLVIIIRII